MVINSLFLIQTEVQKFDELQDIIRSNKKIALTTAKYIGQLLTELRPSYGEGKPLGSWLKAMESINLSQQKVSLFTQIYKNWDDIEKFKLEDISTFYVMKVLRKKRGEQDEKLTKVENCVKEATEKYVWYNEDKADNAGYYKDRMDNYLSELQVEKKLRIQAEARIAELEKKLANFGIEY
jgi:hypothetical protein